MFTVKDRIFLQKIGISAGSVPEDGTTQTLRECGVPVTWENYLMLAFMGNLPEELDGEIEAMINPDNDEEDDE